MRERTVVSVGSVISIVFASCDTLFRFAPRDGVLFGAVLLLTVLSAWGILREIPMLSICFGVLCALPSLGEGREKLRWRS